MEQGWLTEFVTCSHCQHKWQAVFSVDTESLECSSCHGWSAIEDMQRSAHPPIHLVISRANNTTYLTVSRSIERIYLAGLLADALAMVTGGSSIMCKPEDCQLKVVLSVDLPDG